MVLVIRWLVYGICKGPWMLRDLGARRKILDYELTKENLEYEEMEPKAKLGYMPRTLLPF